MRSTGSAAMRVLGDRDAPEVLDLLAEDAVPNVFVASRVQQAGCDPWRLGAQMWGLPHDGPLRSVCYSGANLVPIAADSIAIEVFAERARRQGRRCSSIVGDAAQVMELWRHLEPHWGKARDVRDCQPLLSTAAASPVTPDPRVRRARPEELDVVLPACVAMFTEEVGVTPLADGGAVYRARIQELISAGRSFIRLEQGQVAFKAEVGAVTSEACQVQGVWVAPTVRGQGRSESGMAAVVELCLRDIAPTVSLYVNDFNAAARRAYDKVGFERIGTFASVLF